jgi:hypothetical protein
MGPGDTDEKKPEAKILCQTPFKETHACFFAVAGKSSKPAPKQIKEKFHGDELTRLSL